MPMCEEGWGGDMLMQKSCLMPMQQGLLHENESDMSDFHSWKYVNVHIHVLQADVWPLCVKEA